MPTALLRERIEALCRLLEEDPVAGAEACFDLVKESADPGGLRMRADLAPTDPSLLRDISIVLFHAGNTMALRNDRPGALACLEEDLSIVRHLLELDPTHREWQRDLVVSLQRLGDLHYHREAFAEAVTLYDEHLNRCRVLSEESPADTTWPSVIANAHFRVGIAHAGLHDHSAALTHIQEARAIHERLAGMDPSDESLVECIELCDEWEQLILSDERCSQESIPCRRP